MRKQYYFRPSKNGFYAWDVDKLVEKTKDLPVTSVALEDIQELDEPFGYQTPATQPTWRSLADDMRFVEQTDLKYPIILSQDGRVMDGMHRVVKALLLGQKNIKAVQFKQDPEPNYVDVQEADLPYDEQ